MGEKKITSQQKKAIQYLSQGLSDSELIEKMHVSKVTLWRWRQTEIFNNALHQMQQNINVTVTKKIGGLIEESKEALLDALKRKEKKLPGYIKVALEILKTYKPTIEKQQQSTPTPQQNLEAEKNLIESGNQNIEGKTDDDILADQIEEIYGKKKNDENN